jgi:hypothetical protein
MVVPLLIEVIGQGQPFILAAGGGAVGILTTAQAPSTGMLCEMLLRLLPLITGFAPIFAVHVSYLIGIRAGILVACNPYIHGCTSISATGRYMPASLLFKSVMMPEAILMAAYWIFNVAWFRSLERAAGRSGESGSVAGLLGVAGALFLIVYVTFLGTQGPFYDFMRRFGVYFYFAFTVFAQLILASKLLPLSKDLHIPEVVRIAKYQLAIALIPFAIGILNLILKAVLEDADAEENIIEWIFALLMHFYFLLSYFSWRATGFDTSFTVEASRIKDDEGTPT